MELVDKIWRQLGDLATLVTKFGAKFLYGAVKVWKSEDKI